MPQDGVTPVNKMSTADLGGSASQPQKVIVVLECASLEIVKVGKAKDSKYHLLNCDDHQGILRRNKRDISEYRPDITHQCLLTLLDSPLNKAGCLSVFVRTQKGVLIEVNPKTRIPRTFSRFSGLVVQLLHKLSIRSSVGEEVLLNVVQNPVSAHLPVSCVKVSMSGDAAAKPIREIIRDDLAESGRTPVFFIGAMPHGSDEFSETTDFSFSISSYSLSASVVCGKICDAFEERFRIF